MVQKLASEFFWPRFQKQDGRHGRFIQILGTFAAPVYERACHVHFPNLQDMFIMVKASLGIILDIWTKTRWPPWGCFFDRFLQNTKSANISKTVRDRAISSEFLTHRVVQEYSVAI